MESHTLPNRIIRHFTDNDLYTFTCQYYVLETYPRAEVEYTFFDRNNTIYPEGFGEILQTYVNQMSDIQITQPEVDFLSTKCNFLPHWYVNTFLKGFKFNPNEVTITQDTNGHLNVSVKGKWYSAIMWEMPLLSMISELSHIFNGDVDKYDPIVEYDKACNKAQFILHNGLYVADMGTRRRFSFSHQDLVIKAFADTMKKNHNSQINGKITGTSNVYFAMKYGLTPIGTMSHQIISFEENVSGLMECNYNVMNKWSKVYDGDNGIYLYDCFGDKMFFNNLSRRMAMLYKGLRVDSGNEEEQTQLIINKYKELGIDPKTKNIVYSNGLTLDRALDIHHAVSSEVNDSYGIGTFLTCDVNNCVPMNIVIKLTKCRITENREWSDCIKLSCTSGKTLGNEDKCNFYLSLINR